MTQRFECLLFDVDDTLYDHHYAENLALPAVFRLAGLPFSEEIRKHFAGINRAVFQAIQQGTMDMSQARTERFRKLFTELGWSTTGIDEFADAYLDQLVVNGRLLPGAEDAVRQLSGHYRIALLTNGFRRMKEQQLEGSPLRPYVEAQFISETEGVAKPDPEIFRRVMRALGLCDPARVMMIGDSLTSDIQGGQAAGMATCWINPGGQSSGSCAPDVILTSVAELPGYLKL